MINFEEIKKINVRLIRELEEALQLAKEGKLGGASITLVREDNYIYHYNCFHSGHRTVLLGGIELTKLDLADMIRNTPMDGHTCHDVQD